MNQSQTRSSTFIHPPSESIQLHIGPYHIRPVPTGVFGLDGGAMFGTVPKVLWEKTNPADAQNRIEMEARALLLDGSKTIGRCILIDCGIGTDFIAKYGEKLGPKFAEMYAIQANAQDPRTAIERNLNAMGVATEAVTDVILTHLHFDHAGGATCVRKNRLVPTFPNATYYIQSANLETAKNPNLREKASYYSANFEPLLDANVMKVLDGPAHELLPCVSVQITHGHTRGQQTVHIADGKSSLIYCADLIPTSTHVKLPWVMGYDLDPLTLIEEKRATLAPAVLNKSYLFFEHDPYIDAAQVIDKGGDYAVAGRFLLT